MAAIVCGYDDSSGSKAALGVAAQLASQTGNPLVIGYGVGPPGSMGDEFKEHREALVEMGRKMTDEAKTQADAAGVDAQVELVEEHGVDALLALAKDHDASFIVVGSYGESPIKGAILGSVPHKLLHLAEVPVVVVPAG
jgi:nucleotide-binding universal stress UspA family protein